MYKEDELFVETTWEAILMEIANPALEKAEIKLNQKVGRVETRNRKIDGGKVVVVTEKGESFEFDEVVMTTPLGWLKRNQGVSQDPRSSPLLIFASRSRDFLPIWMSQHLWDILVISQLLEGED